MITTEKEFLLAVERGNIADVKRLFESAEHNLNINCIDPLDRNALVIAIDNENLEMLKLLIEANVDLGDALLHAIDADYVGAVELLVDHEDIVSKTSDDDLFIRKPLRESSFFTDDITPLILAAHRNNYAIVKILLDRQVSPMPDPHDPRCDCSPCCLARADDCLKHSRSRINAYRALAAPCLMALSSPDPMLTAFELSAKLENLAQMEPEYKQEYLRFRAQCQTFATKLLDHAKTSKELEVLLNYSDDLGEDNQTNLGQLSRLKLAIHCKQKTFCAHPNVQELLATMWYENLPGFKRKNSIAQIIQVIFIGLMFPVYSVAYLVAPHTQLGRYIKKPFIKFICHSASYITFLIVLILASQRVEVFYSWNSFVGLFSSQDEIDSANFDANFTLLIESMKNPPPNDYDDMEEINRMAALYKQLGSTRTDSSARSLDSLSKIFVQLPASSKKRGSLPSPIEVLILLWVLSLIWAEIKQLRALGMNYYKADMWNTLDSVASGFYVGAIILRIVSYLQSDAASIEVAREHWHAYDPTLLSEGLFAAATIFSALKLVYIFSVNPYLGPLQISLGRMIIDIIRFSWIFMLVLFSFSCGMNQLLWYYADLERHQCLNITNYNLAQYYKAQQNLKDDSVKPPVTIDDSCKTWRYFSNVFESSQTLFWATFGLVDLENFDLTGIRQYTRFWALLMFGCYCFLNVIVVLNLLIAMMNHSYVKISKKSDIEWKFARTRLWMSYFDTGSTVPAPFNILPSFKSITRYQRGDLPLANIKSDHNGHIMHALVRRFLVVACRSANKRKIQKSKLHR